LSRSEVAGKREIGHDTSESLRKPFQYARAATGYTPGMVDS
jgi:hypothetical protein